MKYKFMLAVAAVSASSYADFTYRGVDVKETSLEQELRERVKCLADGDLSKCSLPIGVVPDSGVINDDTNGAVHFAKNKSIDLATVESIAIRYSGGEFSSSLPADFDLKQDCSTLSNQLLERHQGRMPSGVSGNGITGFGKNVSYNCMGGHKIQPDSVAGSVDSWSLNGTVKIDTKVRCDFRSDIDHPMSGGDGSRYWDYNCDGYKFSHYRGGGRYGRDPVTQEHSPRCDTSSIVGNGTYGNSVTIECLVPKNRTALFQYTGRYEVAGTPSLPSNNEVAYSVTSKYSIDKRRASHIPGFDPLVPVAVGDITIFVPGVGSEHNSNTSVAQFSDSVDVPLKNKSKFTYGCDKYQFDWNMSDKAFSYILEKDEINVLYSRCGDNGQDISLRFNSLMNPEDLHWRVIYTSSGNETAIWEKYSDFLTMQVSDELVSAEYISQLESVAQQSTSDTQSVIKTLSDRILGKHSILPSGVKGFLEARGSAWGIDSAYKITQELSRIVTTSVNHKYGVGALMVDSAPEYWNSFVQSSYAQSVDYYTTYTHLTMAKNIIDVSNGGQDTTTLRAQVAEIASHIENKRRQVVAKAEQFLEVYVERRTDLDAQICPSLNKLRVTLGIDQESCTN